MFTGESTTEVLTVLIKSFFFGRVPPAAKTCLESYSVVHRLPCSCPQMEKVVAKRLMVGPSAAVRRSLGPSLCEGVRYAQRQVKRRAAAVSGL